MLVVFYPKGGEISLLLLSLASHTSWVAPLTRMRKLDLLNGFWGEDLPPAVSSWSSDGFSSPLNVCVCVFVCLRRPPADRREEQVGSCPTGPSGKRSPSPSGSSVMFEQFDSYVHGFFISSLLPRRMTFISFSHAVSLCFLVFGLILEPLNTNRTQVSSPIWLR